METENKVVDNNALPPDKNLYHLRNPPTINYNKGRYNWRSVILSNLIDGARSLHNFSKSYANTVNDITIFIEPTTPTNIITNETILIQYSIKQVLNFLGGGIKSALQKYLQPFYDRRVVDPKKTRDITCEKIMKSLS